MSTAPPPTPAADPPPARGNDVFAALLSYLVPGLGQVYQGRVGKGLMFMVCLLGMFVLGMYLGNWSNVYLPRDTVKDDRLPFLNRLSERLRHNAVATVDRLPFAGQFWIGVAAWPALLQFNEKWPVTQAANPFWHKFQAMPSEADLNQLQRDGDKSWDLGWVYTVIAGVLNILVIYDALAGPVFAHGVEEPRRPEESAASQQEVAVP